MKREFLQKAKYWRENDYVSGWYMSEKLDGIRCFWDGGISVGLWASEIPWSGETKQLRATGLWSQYGRVLCAPGWWYKLFPRIPMDGELFAGRQNRQYLSSVVMCDVPNDRWKDVVYAAFDSPAYEEVFKDGMIDSAHFKKQFMGIMSWIASRKFERTVTFNDEISFDTINSILSSELKDKEYIIWCNQLKLPMMSSDCINMIEESCTAISGLGGEGLMLRRPVSSWVPERTHNLLKVKPYKIGMGTVISIEPGLGRLVGMIGALNIELPNGVKFGLSGLTDEERRLSSWIGEKVCFKYRDLTDDGLPIEARFCRETI